MKKEEFLQNLVKPLAREDAHHLWEGNLIDPDSFDELKEELSQLDPVSQKSEIEDLLRNNDEREETALLNIMTRIENSTDKEVNANKIEYIQLIQDDFNIIIYYFKEMTEELIELIKQENN